MGPQKKVVTNGGTEYEPDEESTGNQHFRRQPNRPPAQRNIIRFDFTEQFRLRPTIARVIPTSQLPLYNRIRDILSRNPNGLAEIYAITDIDLMNGPTLDNMIRQIQRELGQPRLE